MITAVKKYLIDLQNRICECIESEDGKKTFIRDAWQHQEGGGGESRIIEQGDLMEKGGVNFSHVYGKALPQAATLKRPELADAPFQALGVSVVMHPVNPYVPTSHMNVRFISVQPTRGQPLWWFGGGFDLTPYYGFEEDCIHWHRMAKTACDPYGDDIYTRYKKWADDYFFLKHRDEPRGIGGIFFDDLNEWGFEKCFAFMQDVGNYFIKAYQPILAKRKNLIYTPKEKAFQLYRRGRYVEFNLLYDRGTLFGLQSHGRVESILMSLPPQVSWHYNKQFESGSVESRFSQEYLVPRNWV